ncbi:MAG: MarR family transcriptional regulator [Candidatus Omnitrophica bacterium]|nr:MarR family transcriptional regulator [Candidatus Omnitrophota bacterium]
MGNLSVLKFADEMSRVMPQLLRGFSRRQADEISKGKITLPQFLILDLLDKGGALKMTALSLFMEVTTAAMTGLVERLVKCGYVKRAFDPGDRRIIKIELSKKGAELVRKISQQRRQMIIKIFGQISEEERANYLNILLRIRDILNKEKEA